MSNYTDRREQILAELAPDEQAVFDEAYAAAGLAMELAETAYRAREAAGLTQTELAAEWAPRSPRSPPSNPEHAPDRRVARTSRPRLRPTTHHQHRRRLTVVAADNAVFGLPEVQRGLTAAGGGLLRLPTQLSPTPWPWRRC